MRKIFEAELLGVGEDLVTMAQAVQEAISKAGVALLEGNHEVAQEVISNDAVIDQMQRDLDERCVHIFAQQAPVATDLRTLVAALRISATLERMGDLAAHVADVARGRYPGKAVRPQVEPIFAGMVEAAKICARDVTQLLRTRDLALADAIARDDDILDNLHLATFDQMLHPDWGGDTQETIDITLLGRYLERFGDHGTSIARRIVFLVTGEIEVDG